MSVRRLAFLVFLFCAALLVSCGGSGNNNAQSSSPTPGPQILYVLSDGTVATYSVDPNTLSFTAVGTPVSFVPTASLMQFEPSPNDHFLYVLWSDAQSQEHLSVYGTDSSGVPQTPPVQTLDVSSLYQFNIHRSGRFAYMMEVTNSNGLYTSEIRLFQANSTTGVLSKNSQIQGTYGPDYYWPASLYGLSSDGGKLYLSLNSPQGTAYRERSVNQHTGTLSSEVRFYAPGHHWGEPVIGKKLMVDDYRTSSSPGYLNVFPNAPNPRQAFIHCTSAMLGACETATNVQLDPSGHYLFLTDPTTQLIHVSGINLTGHRIADTGNSIPFTAETPGFSFSPDGTLVYAILASDSSVHVYGFDSGSGALTPGPSPLPLPASGGICPAQRH
jgi:hypothetical protein